MYYCYFGPLRKQGNGTLQLLLGSPLESKVAYLDITVAVGPLWQQGTLHITVAKRGPRQVPRLPTHASLYITLTIIIYENMKPIERGLLHPICVLSHLMCACKHCNVKLSWYYWAHWSCWWVYHFKK